MGNRKEILQEARHELHMATLTVIKDDGQYGITRRMLYQRYRRETE